MAGIIFKIPPISSLRSLPSSLRRSPTMAAVTAIHVSDLVPSLDTPPFAAIYSTAATYSDGVVTPEIERSMPKFPVIGHRGNGMNALQSSDRRMRAIKENTIVSFNAAAKFAVDYIEFDVQVTEDNCPVIFHDNFILSQENGTVLEKRVTDLSLSEFLCYGPQRDLEKEGKPLLRKTNDGNIVSWNVEQDDPLCTLQEAFQKVEPSLGFNIELKFDDYMVYEQDCLVHNLQAILKVVFEYAKDRPIIFSTFQPDAARLVRKLQSIYPVYFLTEGGIVLYDDARRNSLDEAIKLCLENGLQGIVSDVEAILKNPIAITKIRDSKLDLLTYGKLNNVSEVVYMQYLMGINGVIVDFVEEITEAVSNTIKQSKDDGDKEGLAEGNGKKMQVNLKIQFSQREMSFLLNLIPKLMQR